MNRGLLILVNIIILIYFVPACSSPGTAFFRKLSPHEQYAQKLKDAGLDETALGRSWIQMAAWGLKNPVTISLPYSEYGYFDGSKAGIASFIFSGKRGELVKISIKKKPAVAFEIYMDLYQLNDTIPDHLKSFISTDTINSFEVEADGNYLLRLQPELLKSGNYNLIITTGPSLAYPIKAPGKNHIKSFWGASRDGGRRSHEGVDLFASLHTPVVAAADGHITRVNENNLGGKVIFMRPEGKNISLYYAHLDSQLVNTGQKVKFGDTIGLMGNTGNARSTAPHLHFGIYSRNGAVDPFPFINPETKELLPVLVDTSALGKALRFTKDLNIENGNMKYNATNSAIAYIAAATANQYKVVLPDSSMGFVNARMLETLKTVRTFNIDKQHEIFEEPNEAAPVKFVLDKGTSLQVIGMFKDFYLVNYNENDRGWIKK